MSDAERAANIAHYRALAERSRALADTDDAELRNDYLILARSYEAIVENLERSGLFTAAIRQKVEI